MSIFDFIFKRRKKDKKEKTDDHDNIYEIKSASKEAKERSDIFLEQHKNNIGEINLNIEKRDPEELEPKELAFLKYINGKTPMQVAGYWTHQANIPIQESIEKFIAMGYLEMGFSLSALKVDELKEILKLNGLTMSGKKQELIDRISENIRYEDLKKLNLKQSLILTKSGENAIKNIPISLTFNHLRDEKVLELIENCNFKEAYKEVCIFESQKPESRGLNMNWESEINKPSKKALYMFQAYEEILNSQLREDKYDSILFARLAIFCDMLGMNITTYPLKNIRELAPFVNQTNLTIKEQNDLNKNSALEVNYIISKYSTSYMLKSILKSGDKYEIIGAINKSSCKKCKEMDGKVFNVDEAIIGETAPPFCKTCSCYVIPYFNDSIQRSLNN